MKFTTHVNLGDEHAAACSSASSKSSTQPLFGHVDSSRKQKLGLVRGWPLYVGLLTVFLVAAVMLLSLKSHRAASHPAENSQRSEGQYSIVRSAGRR